MGDEDAVGSAPEAGPPRRDAGIPCVRDDGFRPCVRAVAPVCRVAERGDAGASLSSGRLRGDEPDSEPALKIEDRRWWRILPGGRLEDAFVEIGTEWGTSPVVLNEVESFGEELESEPGALTARMVDIGLVPDGTYP